MLTVLLIKKRAQIWSLVTIFILENFNQYLKHNLKGTITSQLLSVTHHHSPRHHLYLPTPLRVPHLLLQRYGMVWREEGESAWSQDIVNLKTAKFVTPPPPRKNPEFCFCWNDVKIGKMTFSWCRKSQVTWCSESKSIVQYINTAKFDSTFWRFWYSFLYNSDFQEKKENRRT